MINRLWMGNPYYCLVNGHDINCLLNICIYKQTLVLPLALVRENYLYGALWLIETHSYSNS